MVILNNWKEHKHTVQTQIRLLHLIGVCTICYSAREHDDDPKYWAEVFKYTLCIQIILLHLIGVSAIFYSAFFKQLAILPVSNI